MSSSLTVYEIQLCVFMIDMGFLAQMGDPDGVAGGRPASTARRQ